MSMPFKEIFARPDILWRQFRRRLDTENPFCVVAGHTEEEVRPILTTFEDIYSKPIARSAITPLDKVHFHLAHQCDP